jgi:hypothetical protein
MPVGNTMNRNKMFVVKGRAFRLNSSRKCGVNVKSESQFLRRYGHFDIKFLTEYCITYISLILLHVTYIYKIYVNNNEILRSNY